jgi:hypothetical protein
MAERGAIHYKFKSAKAFATVDFEGSLVTLFQLKKLIVRHAQLGVFCAVLHPTRKGELL